MTRTNYHTVEAQFFSSGLLCVCTLYGHRYGYVGVPPSHPLWGKKASDQIELLVPIEELNVEKLSPLLFLLSSLDSNDDPTIARVDTRFNVNGGITYASGNPDYPVPHDGLWFFGFDTIHAADFDAGGRSLEFVKDECESLASQLSEYAALHKQKERARREN